MNGFTWWVALGAALGVWRVAVSAPRQQSGVWTNISLAVLLAALIGARACYVALNWAYFASRPVEIPQVWLGGLCWPGAVFGMGMAAILLAFLLQQQMDTSANPRDLLGWLGDRIYPLLPPVALGTWLGSWQAGSAYGAALPPDVWWGVPSLDQTGSYTPHVPLQPLAALSLLAYFWLIEARAQPLRPPGRLSGLATAGLLLHLLVTSLLRADPAPVWHNLRFDTWAAIFFLTVYLVTGGLSHLFFRPARDDTLPFAERSSS